MNKMTGSKQVWILISIFILSRIIVMALGLHLNIWALYSYWQYLDVVTLKQHLLTGIWYDHAQPPVFNLLLGIILKISGNYAVFVFDFLFKIISLVNILLLFSIIRKLTVVPLLPFLMACIYMLSPATLIFECELFYTSFISMLLLLSVTYMIRFSETGNWKNAAGILFPLVLLCLTRSVYHIVWLFISLAALLFSYLKKEAFYKLLLISILGLVFVGGWYAKNKIIFGKLTLSTWIGMNIARNVFHDNEVNDSTRIEAYVPFSSIHNYYKFIDLKYQQKFAGLNDRDLLSEMKNDSFINEREVSYIPVSDLYMKVSMDFIRSHPTAYAKNVLQSFILYFTPATMYSLAIQQSDKIKYYDLIYSFNLTHFAKGKQQRRILLTISAIPKLIFYFIVFYFMISYCIHNRSIPSWNLFIMLTIFFVFGISSFFEHYENMRFRYETEPLFFILAAQVISRLYSRFQIRRNPPIKSLIA